MSLQQYPICWECESPVEYDAVYEAICGHEKCPSSVFHGLCLFTWRERRDEMLKAFHRWLSRHPEFNYPEEN